MTVSLQSFAAHASHCATYLDSPSTRSYPFEENPLPKSKWARASDRLYHRLHSMNQARPIGSLPPEILCQIFEFANYSQPVVDRRSHSHQSPLPITFSQVSAYWREVALEDPLLWTHVDVSPPWSFNGICMALSRAKACPLSINLTVPNTAFGNSLTPTVINSCANVLCDIIAPHLPRCRKLVIKGDFCQLEPLFVSLMKTLHNSVMPLLEHLVIQPTGVRHLATEAEAHSFVQGVPPLSHLRVTSAMAPNLPRLDKLTSLYLTAGDRRALSITDFSTLSISFPHLETLVIYDDAISGTWPQEGTIIFPTLHSLQIYGSFMSVSDLLRVVEAPLLEDLVIAPFATSDLTEYRQYASYSPTKFEALKSITLSPVSSSGFALLVEAAECFPTVELVMIPNIHAESFRDVFTGENAEIVWPRLKALALRNIDCMSMARLLPVIAFREAAGRPLQTLYLDPNSIQRVSSMLPSLPPTLDVLERDIWSNLHDGDLGDAAAHFVGNDFDFIP
ncbi:hypothetical protein H0H87_000599 [Tephrocybe sp. NHM501043]|nr:hypothetical protein H0H87_000599 [Tephrocybe sp. NHM501043]